MMKGAGAFPPCFTNLTDTLELYFQICSLLSTSKAMSIMASTLANGGLNPLTVMIVTRLNPCVVCPFCVPRRFSTMYGVHRAVLRVWLHLLRAPSKMCATKLSTPSRSSTA